MSKQDVTKQSDRELSLIVFNDEYLYLKRRSRYFLSIIDELFTYRPEQLEVLKQDLLDDEAEA